MQTDFRNEISQDNLVLQNSNDQNEPLRKKIKKPRRETKPEEKQFLEPLIKCLTNEIQEILGNEWDKNRIRILLSEYLDDPCGSIGQRAIDTRKMQTDFRNEISQDNLVLQNSNDQNEPLRKKIKKPRRETKPEEKQFLEPLIKCLTNEIQEILGNEWDKNRISQYISRHRQNKNNN
ncbi:hypothetical protein Glove_88g138 [Diversispora epigaea]|uniref:Uncharacterized protein n=1 Tax=Diversispora epigaea TaxID=1348612 RepID=A0A397JGD9_9GLOM|nr:hypothetical protein Glove_88g138 [Diversispora epigaea]